MIDQSKFRESTLFECFNREPVLPPSTGINWTQVAVTTAIVVTGSLITYGLIHSAMQRNNALLLAHIKANHQEAVGLKEYFSNNKTAEYAG